MALPDYVRAEYSFVTPEGAQALADDLMGLGLNVDIMPRRWPAESHPVSLIATGPNPDNLSAIVDLHHEHVDFTEISRVVTPS